MDYTVVITLKNFRLTDLSKAGILEVVRKDFQRDELFQCYVESALVQVTVSPELKKGV